ncbi:hypothetical protein, partial [Salinimicrobium terrae]|uniref:hypothetical protein n=1 Tax=Salinimicrobium terrae TaxID=470866 RepID=UPI000559F9FF
MRIIFTPVKILVFFLLAGSPVLASFWSYPIVGTYSYPQKKMDSPTPWFESPKGIFTINFTGGSENPTVTAPANDQENTETGKCEATISIPNVTYTGNNLTWSMSGASTDSGTGQVGTHVFLKGKTTIVFTAHGENNSTAQDVMEVTVTDNEDPKITLGNDISDTTDAGQCTASIAIPNAVFSDNCSGATLSWTMTGATSGSANGQVGTKSFNIGTTEISYTVIDAANRTISQSVKITVTDNEDPKITLENDISETTDVGQCTTSIAIPNAVFSDNC